VHAELAYLFRHALMRSAAYDLQMPTERARLHRIVLELSETLLCEPGNQESLDPYALELADHARAAREALQHVSDSRLKQDESYLETKEAHYLERAGMWARRSHRPAERRRCQSRLIELPAASPIQKAVALLELAEAMRDLGEGAAALELVRRALREGVRLGLDEVVGRSLLALAILSEGRGQLAKARRLYTRAIARFERCQYGRGLALAVIYCAELKNRMGLPAECESDIRRARQLLEECEPGVRAMVLQQIALIRNRQGRSAEAEELFKTLVLQSAGRQEVLASALVNYASLLADLGRPQEAGHLLRQSLAAAAESGARMLEASTRGEYARLLQNQGRLDEAHAQYRAALELAVEYGLEATEGTLRQNLASLHMDRGRPADAELEYRASLALRRKLGDVSGQGFCLCSVALCRQQVGDFSQAESLYAEGLELIRAVAAGRYEGIFLGYLGDLYAETERTALAVQAYEQALRMHRTAEYPRYEAIVLGNLGSLRFRQGELSEGVALLEQAISVAQRSNEVLVWGAASGELAQCHLLLGRAAEARATARNAERQLRAAGCHGAAIECAAVALRCDLELGTDVAEELNALQTQADGLTDPAPATKLRQLRQCLEAADHGEPLFRGHRRAELSVELTAALEAN